MPTPLDQALITIKILVQSQIWVSVHTKVSCKWSYNQNPSCLEGNDYLHQLFSPDWVLKYVLVAGSSLFKQSTANNLRTDCHNRIRQHYTSGCKYAHSTCPFELGGRSTDSWCWNGGSLDVQTSITFGHPSGTARGLIEYPQARPIAWWTPICDTENDSTKSLLVEQSIRPN